VPSTTATTRSPTPAPPGWKFGSAHPSRYQFAFCDGSVPGLLKVIDPATLGLLARRNDGQSVADF
jgi:prepilin-type processing-associated H-X9-DG protein